MPRHIVTVASVVASLCPLKPSDLSI